MTDIDRIHALAAIQIGLEGNSTSRRFTARAMVRMRPARHAHTVGLT